MSADGQLWFVTGRGLALVDPSRFKRPRPPVAVRLDQVTVDGRNLPLGTPAALKSRTSRIVINYGALELSTPDKVRFRYRLDGFDADWIEAGTRRQASYDNLPPRKYQFHVAASLMEGVWTEPDAVWEFSVTPVFYETSSFAILVGASLLAGVWMFWQLRLRRNRLQFAALLGERVRLSRELHDTLLQSLVGAALQLEAASNSVQSPSARERLMNARRHVEDYIREARLSIWNLRSPQPDTHGLVRRLEDTAERLSVAVPVEVKVHGLPSTMEPALEANLLHIGQEAILNAAHHANAQRVSVEIRCTADAVALRVADDGCGFDASRWTASESGHLGLVSMRERAAQVGARFALHSRPGAGTVVEVVAPLQRHAESRAS
jgi:signal transduction histidine kinase